MNGKEVPLKADGENQYVKFEEIELFMKLAKEKRMKEFDEQVCHFVPKNFEISTIFHITLPLLD